MFNYETNSCIFGDDVTNFVIDYEFGGHYEFSELVTINIFREMSDLYNLAYNTLVSSGRCQDDIKDIILFYNDQELVQSSKIRDHFFGVEAKLLAKVEFVSIYAGSNEDGYDERLFIRKDLLPKLTDISYQVLPSLVDLYRMTERQLSRVENLVISNEFGQVRFLEPVDLRAVDICSTIKISSRSVEIYNESSGNEEFLEEDLTPEGPLEKKVEITYWNWEKNEQEKNIDDKKFQLLLLRWCSMHGADFVSWENTGYGYCSFKFILPKLSPCYV